MHYEYLVCGQLGSTGGDFHDPFYVSNSEFEPREGIVHFFFLFPEMMQKYFWVRIAIEQH